MTIRPTFLDRAIGILSPGMMHDRIRKRIMTDVMIRGYDAAVPSRQSAGWRRGSTSADAEIASAGPMLRDAMRDLVRNNPHAAKATSVLVAYLVGDGIMPRANTGDRAKDRAINALWDRFSGAADADGQLSVYGLQTLAVREMVEGGEALMRRRPRRSTDGLEVPVQFQIMEGDLIDSSKEGPTGNGGVIIQGVEFNGIGSRTAYWLWNTHPGNSHLDPRWTVASRPVPAVEIAHLYEKQRTQIRGVPWGAPAIMDTRNLGDYEVAELMRKKIEACAVGVVTGDEDGMIGAAATERPGVYDASGKQVEQFEPGMFLYARGGRQITFHSPSTSGGYEAYKRSMLHTIASGWRVPYSFLSGDLSQNSYASQKVGMADFYRLMIATQWQTIIPMLCEPMWRWFCEAAFLAGKIDTPTIPVVWNPPPFPSADPEKDIKADIMEIRAGLSTLPRKLGMRGQTIDDTIEEIRTTNEALDSAGIILDSDPRQTTNNGQKQVTPAEAGAALGGGSSGAPA